MRDFISFLLHGAISIGDEIRELRQGPRATPAEVTAFINGDLTYGRMLDVMEAQVERYRCGNIDVHLHTHAMDLIRAAEALGMPKAAGGDARRVRNHGRSLGAKTNRHFQKEGQRQAATAETAYPLRERTVRFVAFTCEEPPYFYTHSMGSQVYAAACRARGDRIIGMLCLEMVGFFSDAPDSQRIPSEIPCFLRPLFPRRGNFLAAVGNMRSWRLCWTFRRGFKAAARFPLFSIVLPERVHSIRLSDNSSFWDNGYAALMLTDTSFLRNPHYHAESDRPGTLNYACMAQATNGVAGGVARLARPIHTDS
jgi:hypothetical protein